MEFKLGETHYVCVNESNTNYTVTRIEKNGGRLLTIKREFDESLTVTDFIKAVTRITELDTELFILVAERSKS